MIVKHEPMTLPPILLNISHFLSTHHVKAIVVGGAVRDHFLTIEHTDYDIEVYGVENIHFLAQLLEHFGSVSMVGKSFGVLKLTLEGYVFDFSLPRIEKKVAEGHRGFSITIDGALAFQVAAKRRDFTMNAIGYDIEKRYFLDPYGGCQDIEHRVLKCVDKQSFQEDPLRVYRGIQFAARFRFILEEQTLQLCKEMVALGMLDELPKERVFAEWKKLLLQAKKPSVGFGLMQSLGMLHYFPELEALQGVPQSAKWHPEGDVWIHTLLCVDAMATLLRKEEKVCDEKEYLQLMFAILCHDLGKAVTTTFNEKKGDYQAIGHEVAGVALTKTLLYRVMDEHHFIESITPFVLHHLKPSQFYKSGAKSGAIRRLATKVNIEKLVKVAKADFLGRTTQEAQQGVYVAGEWLLMRAEALKVKSEALPNLLQGKDLIALGLEPSKQFKKILDEVYALYLEGILYSKEEAIHYVKERYKSG
jgi:tRNA nucleotidyltransferase (CCA-adding enzyme)